MNIPVVNESARVGCTFGTRHGGCVPVAAVVGFLYTRCRGCGAVVIEVSDTWRSFSVPNVPLCGASHGIP